MEGERKNTQDRMARTCRKGKKEWTASWKSVIMGTQALKKYAYSFYTLEVKFIRRDPIAFQD